MHEPQTAQTLPCKYPRFTRFMTSLAVRLETSSTSQERGEKRLRGREQEKQKSGGQEKEQK